MPQKIRKTVTVICAKCQKSIEKHHALSAQNISTDLYDFIKSVTPLWTLESYLCDADARQLRILYIQTLLVNDQDHIKYLNNEVIKSIEASELITHNFNQAFNKNLKIGDSIADAVAKFGGSWKFIISFSCFMALWIIMNSLVFLRAVPFDPYPFILLNLVLS